MAKPLTAKQELFCNEYLIDLNATQAAIRAGYSKHTATDIGCENLAKPNIAEKIGQLFEERTKKVKVDAEWVLIQAVKLHNRCMQTEPVLDRNGEHMQDDDGNCLYKFEHTGASKSLELIGKHVDVKAFDGETSTDNKPIHKIEIEVVK